MGNIVSAVRVAEVMWQADTALSLPRRIYHDHAVWSFERAVLCRKSWMAIRRGAQAATPGGVSRSASHDGGLYGTFSPRWERNLLHFHQYLARQYAARDMRNDLAAG